MIECEPPLRVLMVTFAIPPASVAVPHTVAPSLRLTVPVGVPLLEVTVTVNLTPCLNVEGLGPEVRLVLVAIWPTTCVSAGDVLPEHMLSPS